MESKINYKGENLKNERNSKQNNKFKKWNRHK